MPGVTPFLQYMYSMWPAEMAAIHTFNREGASLLKQTVQERQDRLDWTWMNQNLGLTFQ